jgi:hypothetical protein
MHYLINNLLNNDLVSICLISGIVCLTTGYFIKTKFLNSSVIETPNSPITFNFNQDQLKEIQGILDRGDKLDKEIEDKLDKDLQTIMGEEDYAKFTQEIQEIEDEFTNELQELFNNEFSNIQCPLEFTDLYFNSSILQLIDIITNLISHFYF